MDSFSSYMYLLRQPRGLKKTILFLQLLIVSVIITGLYSAFFQSKYFQVFFNFPIGDHMVTYLCLLVILYIHVNIYLFFQSVKRRKYKLSSWKHKESHWAACLNVFRLRWCYLILHTNVWEGRWLIVRYLLWINLNCCKQNRTTSGEYSNILCGLGYLTIWTLTPFCLQVQALANQLGENENFI